MRRFTATGIATAMVATLALMLPPAAGAANEFKKAPALKLPNLEEKDQTVDFASAGVTLVNFWATWCLPCREEMPAIERLYGKYREKGFRAVGITVQSGEPADVKAFLEKRGIKITYPLLMGTDDTITAWGDIDVVPTTYLVGPAGDVLKTYFGVTPSFEAEVRAEIEKILAIAR